MVKDYFLLLEHQLKREQVSMLGESTPNNRNSNNNNNNNNNINNNNTNTTNSEHLPDRSFNAGYYRYY